MSEPIYCNYCNGEVVPAKEAHIWRFVKGNDVCFHADCWQEVYAKNHGFDKYGYDGIAQEDK